jgi:hypothetical protein
VTETEPLADRPDLIAELDRIIGDKQAAIRRDVLHIIGNNEQIIQSQRRIIIELYDALDRIMDYAHTGAAARDVDPVEQPQFVKAKKALANVKFLRESEADIERAKQVNTMFDAVLGSLK